MKTHTPIQYGVLRGIDPKSVSIDELIAFVRAAGHQLVIGRPEEDQLDVETDMVPAANEGR